MFQNKEIINIIEINVREYRRWNKKWTIQRNWQQDDEKQNKKHNTICCWTPLYVSKHKQPNQDMSTPTNNWR